MFKQLENRKILFLFGFCVALATTGCATGVMTSKHKEYKDEGVSYFLPRNDIRVVFTNATIASDIRAATKKRDIEKQKKTSATEALKRAELALADAKGKTSEEIKKLQGAVAEAKKTVAAAAKDVLNAEADLAKKKNKKAQILIEVLPPVPDTSQLYVTALSHSWFNDDTVTINTSPEGLLTQVTYKGEDRTGDIVQNLVETGIEAAKLYARLQGIPIPATDQENKSLVQPPDTCTPKETGKEYYWEFTIDPSDPAAVALVNQKLINTPLPFLVNLRAPDQKFAASPDLADSKVPGLLYRRAIPYTVEILEDRQQKEDICKAAKWVGSPLAAPAQEDKGPSLAEQRQKIQCELEARKGGIPTSKSKQVLMVSGGPVTVLEFGDRPFVTTDLSATFKQGVLLSSSETRPSEVAGFTMIPLNALRAVGDAVGSLVTNIIPFKIDYTNNSTELVEAETKLLEAQQANAEAQKQVLDQFESGNQPLPEAP